MQAVPEDHHYVSVSDIRIWTESRNKAALAPGFCAACKNAAQCTGTYPYMPSTHGGARNLSRSPPNMIPQRSFGCDRCKVPLCKDCFGNKSAVVWNHYTKCPPVPAVRVG